MATREKKFRNQLKKLIEQYAVIKRMIKWDTNAYLVLLTAKEELVKGYYIIKNPSTNTVLKKLKIDSDEEAEIIDHFFTKYSDADILEELDRLILWCKDHRRKPTPRRLQVWLEKSREFRKQRQQELPLDKELKKFDEITRGHKRKS